MTRIPSYVPMTFVETGRILAIDYGTKNVGLACCDELRVTVRPLESIPNRGKKDLIKQLLRTIDCLQIAGVVIGVPLNMDGSAGDAVARVERFTKTLCKAIPLPVKGVDERLSTAEAAEIWREMTPRQQKRHRTVDSMAAALILKRFLEET